MHWKGTAIAFISFSALILIVPWMSPFVHAETGYTIEQLSLSGYDVDQICIADIDGDGRLDIFALRMNRYSDQIQLWLQNVPATRTETRACSPGGSQTRLVEPFTSAPSIELDLDYNPTWMTVTDLNADTRPDIVYSTTERDTSYIAVLWQDPVLDRYYNESAVFLTAGTDDTYGRIATGDLNGDGRPDLAVCVGDGSRIDIYYQLVNMSFPTVPSLAVATGQEPQDIVIADIDNDDRNDLVIAEYLERDIRVWLSAGGNSGLGLSGAADHVIDVPEKIEDLRLAVADLNGDSRVDIIAGPYLIYQTATGFHNEYQKISAGPITIPYDVNGDGLTDLVAPEMLGYGTDIGYYLQQKNHTLPFEPDYSYHDTVYELWLGDIDSRGDVALVYATSSEIRIAWPEIGIELTELTATYSSVREGYDAPVTVKIKNTRDMDIRALTLEIFIDGELIDTYPLTCPSPVHTDTEYIDVPTTGHSGTVNITVRLTSAFGPVTPAGGSSARSVLQEITPEKGSSVNDAYDGEDMTWMYYLLFFLVIFILPVISRAVTKHKKRVEEEKRKGSEPSPIAGGPSAPARARESEQASAMFVQLESELAAAQRVIRFVPSELSMLRQQLEQMRHALAYDDGRTAEQLGAAAHERLRSMVDAATPVFAVNLEGGTARTGEWVRMELVFDNTGPADIADLRTNPSGGVQIEALDRVEYLARGQQYTDEIGVKAREPGSVPLILEFPFERAYDHARFASKHEFWLDVSRGLEGVTTIHIDRSVKISDSVIQRSEIRT